jgi:gamma-glutamyltranspeptidase/glutathione hydrolase
VRAGTGVAAFLLVLSGCASVGERSGTAALQAGVVVCEQPLAADVGASILAQGGNAADAAVATALALAVVYPQAGNLGGGGFALWCSRNGDVRALDFREVAPADADPARLFDDEGRALGELLLWSPLAVGVPGSPAGLEELLARCGSGRFTLAQLCAPAVKLAREGFVVPQSLSEDLRDAEDRERLERSSAARELFYPFGEPLRAGDVLVQPELALTLERYALEGSRGFYFGATADALVEELARAALALPSGALWERGWVTPEDLADYRPKWREPLRATFRGREVWTMPPPSSGGIVLLQVLGVLELRQAFGASWDARFAHELAEAFRASFAERAEVLGDPDFVAVPVEELLSEEWAQRTAASIAERASVERVPVLRAEGMNTTHLSVVDREGNAVSLTTTLNSSFGSGRVVRGAGFLLNNELDDFALGGGARNQFGLVGSSANRIRAGARPLSSMTPTIVRKDGRVELVLGSPGGPRIISAVTQVLLRVLAFGEELDAAVAAPRLHQQWSPRVTRVERDFPVDVADELERRGHEVERSKERFASVQAIGVRSDGAVMGVSDPRRDGAARSTAPRP